MDFFNSLRTAVGAYAGVNIQAKSDILINKHTGINVFMMNSGLRAYADELIKRYYTNGVNGQLTEHEEALLKLAIFYVNAKHHTDEHMQALFADGVSRIRVIGRDNIRPRISLGVMMETGL